MEWVAHHKILTLALFAGVFVVVKAARGSGSDSTENTDYNGPSIIGGPGPVVTMPGGTGGAGGTATGGGMDMQAFINGEVEKMRESAKLANVASSNTTNKDLIATFLTKINPGKLAGQQINLDYNEAGQIKHFDFTKMLTPQTDVEKARANATINQIQRSDLLKANAQGFTTAAGTFTDWFNRQFSAAQTYVTRGAINRTAIRQNASTQRTAIKQKAATQRTGINQRAWVSRTAQNAAAGYKINAAQNDIKIKAAAVGKA